MRSLLSLALLGFSGATPAEGYDSQSSVKNWFDLLRACPKVASACQVPTARFPSSTDLNAARDCVKAHLNSEQRGPCYDAMDKFSRVSTKLSSQDDRRDNDDDDDDDDKWSRKWGGEKTKWWGREEGSKDDKQRPSFDEGDKHRRSEEDKDRRPSFDKEDKDKDDKRRPSLDKDDKNEDGKHRRPFPFNKNKDDKDQRSSSNKDSKDDKRRPSFDKNDKDDKHMPRSPFDQDDERRSDKHMSRPLFDRDDERRPRPPFDKDDKPMPQSPCDRDGRGPRPPFGPLPFDQDDERRSDKHMPRPPFDRDDERRPRPPFDKDDKPMPQSPFDRDGHGPRPPFGPLPFDQDDERRPRPSFDWDDERRSDKHMSRPPFDKDDNRSPFKRSPFDGKHWPWPLFEEDNKQMPPFDKRSPFDDWSRPSFDKDDQHWPRLPFDKDDKHMSRPPFDEFMPRFPFDRDMPRLSGFFDMSSKGDNWMPDFQDKRPFPFFPRMDRDMMDFSRPSFSPRSLFLSRLDQDESFPMWGSSPSFSGLHSGLWPSFPRQPSLSSFGGQSFGFAFQPSSGLPRPPTFSMSAPLDPMFVRFALSRAPQVQPPFFLGQQQSMPSPGVLQKRPLVLQRTQFKQLQTADSENVEVSDDANDADIYSNDDDAPYSPVQLQFLKIERGN